MVKERSVPLYILIYVLTGSLFSFFWMAVLTDDTTAISGEKDVSGGMAILLDIVTCGLYTFYWMYKQGDKIDAAKKARGEQSSYTGLIYLGLSLLGFGIISYTLMQNEVNKFAA